MKKTNCSVHTLWFVGIIFLGLSNLLWATEPPVVEHLRCYEGLGAPLRLCSMGTGAPVVSDPLKHRIIILDESSGIDEEVRVVPKPLGIASAGGGDLWVGSQHTVWRIDPSGLIVGQLGSTSQEFLSPVDIAVAPDQRVYVVDGPAHRVRMYSNDGTFFGDIGCYGAGDGQFRYPAGLAIDPIHQELYVSDQWNTRIQVFTLEGMFIRSFGSLTPSSGPEPEIYQGTFSRPGGLAVDATGRVYIADLYQTNVQVLDREGNFLCFISRSNSGSMWFHTPTDVEIDQNGRLWVSSPSGGHVDVFEIDAQGVGDFGVGSNELVTYRLDVNYPNPFNPETVIPFYIGRSDHVSLSIYNLLGQKIAIIQDGTLDAGNHQVRWTGVDSNGKSVASGIYFVCMKAGRVSFSRKIVLLR